MARPKSKIDWKHVGEMLEAGATAVGIAAYIGIEEDTLRKRCPGDIGCSFSEYSQQKKAKGREMIRVKQFKVAMRGDKTMLIWLGKQRLGQREVASHQITGKDGQPLMPQVIRIIAPASTPPLDDRGFIERQSLNGHVNGDH